MSFIFRYWSDYIFILKCFCFLSTPHYHLKGWQRQRGCVQFYPSSLASGSPDLLIFLKKTKLINKPEANPFARSLTKARGARAANFYKNQATVARLEHRADMQSWDTGGQRLNLNRKTLFRALSRGQYFVFFYNQKQVLRSFTCSL